VIPVEIVNIEVTCWSRHVSVSRQIRIMLEEKIVRLPDAVLVLVRIPFPIPKFKTTRSYIPIRDVLLAARVAEIRMVLPSRTWRADSHELIDGNFSCCFKGICTITCASRGRSSILLASSVATWFLRGTLVGLVREIFVRTIAWERIPHGFRIGLAATKLSMRIVSQVLASDVVSIPSPILSVPIARPRARSVIVGAKKPEAHASVP